MWHQHIGKFKKLWPTNNSVQIPKKSARLEVINELISAQPFLLGRQWVVGV